MPNAINHSKTGMHFMQHRGSLETPAVWMFNSWSTSLENKVTQSSQEDCAQYKKYWPLPSKVQLQTQTCCFPAPRDLASGVTWQTVRSESSAVRRPPGKGLSAAPEQLASQELVLFNLFSLSHLERYCHKDDLFILGANYQNFISLSHNSKS